MFIKPTRRFVICVLSLLLFFISSNHSESLWCCLMCSNWLSWAHREGVCTCKPSFWRFIRMFRRITSRFSWSTETIVWCVRTTTRNWIIIPVNRSPTVNYRSSSNEAPSLAAVCRSTYRSSSRDGNFQFLISRVSQIDNILILLHTGQCRTGEGIFRCHTRCFSCMEESFRDMRFLDGVRWRG